MSVQTTQTPRQYPSGSVAQAQDAAVFERSGAGVYLTVEWIAAFAQQTLGNGQAISFGSTTPSNATGVQNDVFFNVTTGEVLRKGATTWAVEANFALDTDVTTAITAAISAHTALADPHPTYLTQAEATALYKPLTTDDSVATGLRFAHKTVITGTPAIGEVQFNNATLSSVTQLLISETGRDGSTIPTLLDMLQATTRIVIQSEQSEGLYAWFNITGAPTDNGTYRTVPVSFVTAPTGVTTVANLGVAGAELTLDFYGVGGSSGGVSSGLKFLYDTSSSLADQNGLFCRNGASFAAATQLSFSIFESQTNDPPTDDVLTRLTTGAIFEIRQSTTAYARYRSTGAPILDENGDVPCYNVPVAFEAGGSDAIAASDFVYLTVVSDAPASLNISGGGISYVEYTVPSVILEADMGAISNTLTRQNIQINNTTEIGKAVGVVGKGAGLYQVSGAGISFLMPDGTNNVGIRNKATHRYNSVELRKISATDWIVAGTNDIAGLELFSAIPPGINSATTATAIEGSSFTYQITAIGAPTSYSATGLPSGLTINTTTGQITGFCAIGTFGNATVTISATNEAGTGSATLTIAIGKYLINSAMNAVPIVDASGHVFTTNGTGVAVDTANFVSAPASIQFSGAGRQQTIFTYPADSINGNFVLSCQLRVLEFGEYEILTLTTTIGSSASSDYHLLAETRSNGLIRFALRNSSGVTNFDISTANNALQTNVFQLIEFVVTGATASIRVNGTQVATAPVTGAREVTAANCLIGELSFPSVERRLIGNMDDVKLLVTP
ncbi:MAG: Ig domain-containing protein [Microcoleus sp.]